MTDMGTIGTLCFGNFATMQINMNKDNFYLLQNNTNQSFLCKYLYVQTILYILQNNMKQKNLGFQDTRLILP